jgi:hypothetical protein
MDTWLPLSLLAAVIVLSGLSYVALLLVYRVTNRAMAQVERMQRDQSNIVGELIAHRTLAETGNAQIAGQMLAHSNAHDVRAEIPEVFAPPAETPDPEIPAAPHVSPEVVFGEEEIGAPPLPGGD